MKDKLIIIRDEQEPRRFSSEYHTVEFEKIISWIKTGRVIKHLFRYHEVRLRLSRFDILPAPFITSLILRALSHGKCQFENSETGESILVTMNLIRQFFIKFCKDFFHKKELLSGTRKMVSALHRKTAVTHSKIDLGKSPVYLRTDFWFDVRCGGSVGHIAGVLNNMERFAGTPILLTTAPIPTVDPWIESHLIDPGSRYWDCIELPSFQLNHIFLPQADACLAGRTPSFIYQRYSRNNFCGIQLAMHYRIPLVLEFNGSEIWINRHWGTQVPYEQLSGEIEHLNLVKADLVVVVSQPLKEQIVEMGCDPEKVLVNPNGVDPDVFSPAVNGCHIRKKLNLNDETVIGFIGTFGRWHGAEVLVEAFIRLMKMIDPGEIPVKLMLIGNGLTMPGVREKVIHAGLEEHVIYAGLIPQADAPAYLAACDILASPHVPNSDGTPFFGSPTKLFEYMAMGKGIVASDLEQIGEILEHEKTALLVRPGDPDDLAKGLLRLIKRPQLCRELGRCAREVVIEKYTWENHTRNIMEKLTSCCE